MRTIWTKAAICLQFVFLTAFIAAPSVAEPENAPSLANQPVAEALPQDCSSESRTLVKSRADNGHINAQHLMGMQAYLGACSDRNLDTAIFYLSKSAAQYFPPSMFHLASVLQLRENTSDTELLRLFRGAAERGFAKAEFNVVAYYMDKDSEVYNIAEAYAWHSFCAPHDTFCRWPEFDEALSHMSKSDRAKGEVLKARLFEKMKSVEKVKDILCCPGAQIGSRLGRH